MQTILQKKEVKNVIDGSCANPIIGTQTGRKRKDNTITSKIIRQRMNSDLYINIISKRNTQRF